MSKVYMRRLFVCKEEQGEKVSSASVLGVFFVAKIDLNQRMLLLIAKEI